MELPRINASEDLQTEDIVSYNHAKLTYRLSKSFSRYDTQYDILPELEFELLHGRAKPDIAICEPAEADWLRDVIRPTTPPLLAVEILSPRQALSDLTDKVLDVYFPSGTLVVWIVIPHFRQVTIMTPGGQTTLTSGVVRNDRTGIELDLAHIFT
jgi:Uma2 family endonuclease